MLSHFELFCNYFSTGNIDNPEGGFDALLQVMVCEEDIGWRDQSRKVIIYTTDQSFHIAMDGKLGGIVTPNDGKCHLNPSGYIYIICRKNKIFFFVK